jgi:hypothetical protein
MLIIRPTDKIEESATAHRAADFRAFGVAVLLTVPSSGRYRSGCGFGFARWRNLAECGTQFVLGPLKIILCLDAHPEGG